MKGIFNTYNNHVKFNLCSATPPFLWELLAIPYIYLIIFKPVLASHLRPSHFTDVVQGLEMEKVQAIKKKKEM